MFIGRYEVAVEAGRIPMPERFQEEAPGDVVWIFAENTESHEICILPGRERSENIKILGSGELDSEGLLSVPGELAGQMGDISLAINWRTW